MALGLILSETIKISPIFLFFSYLIYGVILLFMKKTNAKFKIIFFLFFTLLALILSFLFNYFVYSIVGASGI